MNAEKLDILFRRIAGQGVHGGIQPQQSPLLRLGDPFRRVIVTVKDDPAMLPDVPDDQIMERFPEILRRLQLIRELAKAFGHDGIQNHIRRGNGGAGAQHAEFELVAGKGEGRSPVPVGGILREFGEHMHADGHIRLFPAAVNRSLLQGVQDFRQLIPQEDGDDRGRRFVAAQPQIVSGTGHGGPQHILMLVHRLDDAEEEQQELSAVIGAVARLQQVISRIGGQAPVVMLSAAVDPLEGLFVQQAHEPMAAGHLLHHFHGQLIMVAGHVDRGIDRGHFVLGRSRFVMLGFRRNTQLPQLLVQLRHEGLNPGLDGAEEMIAQLLSLGRHGPEEGAPGEDQIAAPVIERLVHQKIFLFRPHAGHHPGGVRPAEQLQNPYRLPVDGLHGPEQGRFFIQGVTAVGAVGRGNEQGMILDEGIRGRIPGGIAPGFEGGPQAAAGQAAGIRLPPDQLLAAELADDLSSADGGNEGVVLFRGDAVQGLEPVGIMGGAPLQRPVLHGAGHHAGDLRVQPAAVIDSPVQRLICFPGQTVPHDLVVEYAAPKDFVHRAHQRRSFRIRSIIFCRINLQFRGRIPLLSSFFSVSRGIGAEGRAGAGRFPALRRK